MSEVTQLAWDKFLNDSPEAHLLQLRSWGELKSSYGWEVSHIISRSSSNHELAPAGAQILFRSLPLGYTLAYLPKGPVIPKTQPEHWPEWRKLWAEVDTVCKKRRSVFLHVEPDLWVADNSTAEDKQLQWMEPPDGFNNGMFSVQPVRTLLVDISGSEEQILGRMKQKTRYNIRLAGKKELSVYPSNDLESFYQLMVETSGRDEFGIHSLEYYKRAYDLFHPAGKCEVILAEFKREPIAGLMIFASGKRAWYFYGASSNKHRERMPNYLLQWEAIRWARSRGCAVYDLWGVPDEDEKALEMDFNKRSDGLWGVYRFKRGFGGQMIRSFGPWDRIYIPGIYKLIRLLVKRRAVGMLDT
ncbi:lipid II:glycine glycyltransferase FemX [Chloroflexota bacterium]